MVIINRIILVVIIILFLMFLIEYFNFKELVDKKDLVDSLLLIAFIISISMIIIGLFNLVSKDYHRKKKALKYIIEGTVAAILFIVLYFI